MITDKIYLQSDEIFLREEFLKYVIKKMNELIQNIAEKLRNVK